MQKGHLPRIETICAWVHSDSPAASWGSTCRRRIWAVDTPHLVLLPSAEIIPNWQSTWRSSTWKPIVTPSFIIHRQGCRSKNTVLVTFNHLIWRTLIEYNSVSVWICVYLLLTKRCSITGEATECLLPQGSLDENWCQRSLTQVWTRCDHKYNEGKGICRVVSLLVLLISTWFVGTMLWQFTDCAVGTHPER